ncbi:MAG: hypothetical protein AAFQ10_03520 [Pseudomonadota bacterium]
MTTANQKRYETAITVMIETLGQVSKELEEITNTANDDLQNHSVNAALGGLSLADEALERYAATLSAVRALRKYSV